MRRFIATLLILLAADGLAVEPGEEALLAEGREWIAAITKRWQSEAGDGVKVWGGVRADQKARRVEVAATGAGTAEAGLLEFLLVNEKGKAYESVAVTSALPSHVVAALQFVGMPQGRAIDYGKRHFWPRGERVKVVVYPVDADGKRGEAIVGTDLIKHREREDAGATFVFVGSPEPAEGGGPPIVDQTGDLISLYSNPYAVMDVHVRTPQGEHYGATTAAAKGAMAQNQHLIFVLEPEYGPDKRRIRAVTVGVGPAAETGELSFRYRDQQGEEATGLDLPKVLAKLQMLIEAGHDPFVTVEYAPETPLSLAAEFAKMLDLAAGRGLLRVEPREGEPYYQALLPDAAWRDRSKRPGQPLELHAAPQDASWSGKLIRPKFVRAEQGWKVETSESPFASLEELLKQVADEEPGQALFYYLPASATYADLLGLYPHFGDKWPTQYVFLDADE